MTAKNGDRFDSQANPMALSWLLVGAGVGVSLVSLLSSDLLVHAVGLGIVGVGGVAACRLAWKDARRTLQHAQLRMTEMVCETSDQLHQERARHLTILRVVEERNHSLAATIRRLQVESASLSRTVAALRSTNEALRIERDLARQLELESEGVALRPGAEVVRLPRRFSA